jgi:hypothetical protein
MVRFAIQEAEDRRDRGSANGQGGPQDYVLSYMWLSAGKANLADVAPKMTPEQIGLAQKMARRCDESNYKQCPRWHPSAKD